MNNSPLIKLGLSAGYPVQNYVIPRNSIQVVGFVCYAKLRFNLTIH